MLMNDLKILYYKYIYISYIIPFTMEQLLLLLCSNPNNQQGNYGIGSS